MSGFGPVRPVPQDDAPFHQPWEGTVFAIQRMLSAHRLYNTDEFRHAQESLDPVTYLRCSYYERWLEAQVRLLVQKGVLDADELARRMAELGAGTSVARREEPALVELGSSFTRDTQARPAASPPRFQPGDRVRTRNMHPKGHTRLPRYARGRVGLVDRLWGTFSFPDTNAHGRGEDPQPLYCVVFEGRELWGDDAEPYQKVSLDLFESYLLPA